MKNNEKPQEVSGALIVLGMHRSGTSTVAGILELCGVWLGSNDELLPPQDDNPKGFFERHDLHRICQKLLQAAGSNWWHLSGFDYDAIPKVTKRDLGQQFCELTETLSSHGTWAIKEPTLSLPFPVLKQYIPDAVYILPVRNPIEIAKSLRTRNQFSIFHGIALWELYTRRALLGSQDEKRIFVSYAELVAEPEETTRRLLNSLQAYGVNGLSLSEEVSAFVSPELRREVVDENEIEALLDQSQKQLWENLINQRDLVAEGQREISKRSAILLQDLEYQHQMRLGSAEELRSARNEIKSLNNHITERDKQIRTLQDECAKAKELRNRVAYLSEHLDTQLNSLQSQLTDARRKPLKHLKRKLTSHLLYELNDMDRLFPPRRREKFLRSAQKRDPKRNDVDSLKASIAGIISTSQPTKQAGSATSQALTVSKLTAPTQSVPLVPVKPVAVMVPVYNAAEDLQECINRLAAFTPAGTDILFIDDASPDPRIKDLLEQAVTKHGMRVLHNSENMGFTKTVNRGLVETSPRDVIILNSDARVTPGWVEGICAAAFSTAKVATVTPMSDRAGAFSAPDIGNDNMLPPGVDEITYARAFRRRSLGLYPVVPTGNGFCMFISRACLQEIGLLDEEAFPRGYGEENDFCMRALRAGWKNLIDDRTYVFHARSKSFGDSKNELLTAGRKVIDERYPEYKSMISVYRESPNILEARSQARKALIDCGKPEASYPRVLYVISTLTGGTPQTNLDLMKALSSSISCFLLRCDSHKMQLWEIVNGYQQLLKEHNLIEVVNPITHLSPEYDAVLSNWLASLDLDIVHIRHPAWHSLSLAEIAQRDGRAVVMSFHDYYTLCPTVKLLDNNNSFCGGTCSSGPGVCKAELWPKDSMPHIKDKWVHVWRARFDKALANCNAFITTSDAARTRLINGLPSLTQDRFWTIPHGREFTKMESIRARPRQSEPLRILVPGNIDKAKGLEVLHALLDEDRDGSLEFHVLGDYKHKHDKHKRLIQHGAYSREAFADKAATIRPHLGAVFSIWDETWCHTLTEMWSVGLPVAAFDFPTVATRVRQAGAGWILDHHDIPSLCRELNRLGRDPKEFSRTQSAVAAWQTGEALAGSTRHMAADYFDVYRHALAHRRKTTRQGDLPAAAKLPPLPQLASSLQNPNRVAVVGPSDKKQASGNASTEIRLWERTQNSFERDVTYVRLDPHELLASLRSRKVDAAIVQRTVVPKDLVLPLTTAFKEMDVPFIFDIDDNLFNVPTTKDPDRTYVSRPGSWYGFFLNSSGLSLCQSFMACKGVLLPRTDCGNCWL